MNRGQSRNRLMGRCYFFTTLHIDTFHPSSLSHIKSGNLLKNVYWLYFAHNLADNCVFRSVWRSKFINICLNNHYLSQTGVVWQLQPPPESPLTRLVQSLNIIKSYLPAQLRRKSSGFMEWKTLCHF